MREAEPALTKSLRESSKTTPLSFSLHAEGDDVLAHRDRKVFYATGRVKHTVSRTHDKCQRFFLTKHTTTAKPVGR
jgi:hypothetical protein